MIVLNQPYNVIGGDHTQGGEGNYGYDETYGGGEDHGGDENYGGGAVDPSITADNLDPDFFLHEVSDAAKDKNAGTITEDQYNNLIEFMVHIRRALDYVDLSHDGSLEHATQVFTNVIDEIQMPNLGQFEGSSVTGAVETLSQHGHCRFLFALFVAIYENADMSDLPDLQATLAEVVAIVTGESQHTGNENAGDGGDAVPVSAGMHLPTTILNYTKHPGATGAAGDPATAAVALDPATLFSSYADYSGVTGTAGTAGS
ncbi:hypothetical protein G647_00217 [Cladophialophora carrionii CBS 160.54]|uniref:Uncharacterized protein n=1 Tax=Cladophialophora carrionii CBS 160.54 TaxID=1279043 RepID=V9DN75_9EURO|nr:uncharacterized protein G647_00217 [Cladophialophora carrionii CBS 160.54]ETI27768.1 hypothetical protein G647_00217 [Cladophialophora carrionii CBS 160.54]